MTPIELRGTTVAYAKILVVVALLAYLTSSKTSSELITNAVVPGTLAAANTHSSSNSSRYLRSDSGIMGIPDSAAILEVRGGANNVILPVAEKLQTIIKNTKLSASGVPRMYNKAEFWFDVFFYYYLKVGNNKPENVLSSIRYNLWTKIALKDANDKTALLSIFNLLKTKFGGYNLAVGIDDALMMHPRIFGIVAKKHLEDLEEIQFETWKAKDVKPSAEEYDKLSSRIKVNHFAYFHQPALNKPE